MLVENDKVKKIHLMSLLQPDPCRIESRADKSLEVFHSPGSEPG